MKQIIVLIATIILGVSLAGTVNGMGKNIDGIAKDTNESITYVLTTGAGITANN